MKRIFKTIFVLFTSHLLLNANTINQSVDLIEDTNEKLKKYQEKIDRYANSKENLLNEFRNINSSLEVTKKYNEQLNEILDAQKEELESLDKQLVDIESTQKNILPLMKKMSISLEKLVDNDIPFLIKERKNRVEKIKRMMDNPKVENHEKYRVLLEAFKIEYDYAKTLEYYQEKIDNKTYNLLRVGRTGLFYQSLDSQNYGFYNKQRKSWEKIEDSKSKSNIRNAIKIAKKQKNVTLINLPFIAKKEEK